MRALPLVLAAALAVAPGPPPAPARGGGTEPSAKAPTRIDYEGTLLFEAHFRRPGEVRAYHSRQSYFTDGENRARLDWTTWEEGDSVLVPETYLVTGDRVFHRDAPGAPWRRFGGERARQARIQAGAGLPGPLQRVARALADPAIESSVAGGRLVGLTRLQAHPRLGDVRDSVSFRYRGLDPVPDSMAMAIYWRDENWRLGQRRVSWSSSRLADSLFAVPDSVAPAPPSEEEDTLSAAPVLAEIAPGVWSADMEDIGSRSLIVEFADHLAVIEMAVGSANGERIADAARRRWPAKPIRYALFSHYHPHYAGGLRAMVAEGATVVTTPGNEAFVRRVAALPFTARPDRLALHPAQLRVVTFADRYELADSTNRLVAINYGERSQHTDEFVVFWLPQQKLLFEAELGWVRVDGSLRASRRAKPLLAWLGEQGLEVDRLVQSWPMRDTDPIVSRARLDSLVQARR